MSSSIFKNTYPLGQDAVVSIIVPVYNVERFIDETIQSVLAQSFDRVQLILVDDGSTDGSAEICKKYVQQYPEIAFIRQANAGVSIARNRGLLEAVGEYVFFMDSDDTIAPDFIASSYAIAKENDADIVLLGEHFVSAHPYTAAAPTCAQFLRKAFLDRYPDIRFPEGIQPCEDGLLSHQLLALTTKVTTHPSAQYFYRKHEHQNHIRLNEDSWKVLHNIPSWLNILVNFYTKYDLWDSHREHLLRFLEHEPFEIRYLRMSLDGEQKLYLFNLIRAFEQKHKLMAHDGGKKNRISVAFCNFLRFNSYIEFDCFYEQYLKKQKSIGTFYLFLSKLIPFSQMRRKYRKSVYKTYKI